MTFAIDSMHTDPLIFDIVDGMYNAFSPPRLGQHEAKTVLCSPYHGLP
jgi:hypothetical protein